MSSIDSDASTKVMIWPLGKRSPHEATAEEAPGLLAASLSLSRMSTDDFEQLDGAMALYDAFYRWRRDATEETHNWPTNKPARSP